MLPTRHSANESGRNAMELPDSQAQCKVACETRPIRGDFART